MARTPRDRKKEYRERKARAQARGFNSPYQETRYRKIARTRAAQSEPVPSVVDFVKESTLRKWGLTPASFDAIRRANRKHSPDGSPRASKIQTYNMAIDRRTRDFSDARVGYIRSFYDAVVNDNTNFYSISPSRRHEYQGTKRLRIWQERQARYLVHYAGIYEVDEFDARYGDGSFVGSIGAGERK
jgi:hypothetical protein